MLLIINYIANNKVPVLQ